MAFTYNFGELRKDVYRLINRYSSRGTVLATNKTADILAQIKGFVNDYQLDLAYTRAKILTLYRMTLNPVLNYSSYDTSEIKQHLPDVDYSITGEYSRGCFFEVDGPATVVLEQTTGDDIYAAIETITVGSTVTTLTEYRRLITPGTTQNTVRLRFTGSYVYNYRNEILYPYLWSTESLVQQNRPYFEYSLPSDYLVLHMVGMKYGGTQVPFTDYILDEASSKIKFYRYYAPAEFLIYYGKKPTDLEFTDVAATDDALVFTINEAAKRIMCYAIAGEILKSFDDLAGGNTLLNQYEIKKSNLPEPLITFADPQISITGW